MSDDLLKSAVLGTSAGESYGRQSCVARDGASSLLLLATTHVQVWKGFLNSRGDAGRRGGGGAAPGGIPCGRLKSSVLAV